MTIHRPTGASSVRVLLGGMPAPLRIQLRRLLSQSGRIEVVVQLFPPAGGSVPAMPPCDWLLLDAGSLPADLQAVPAASGSRLKCLVLQAGEPGTLAERSLPGALWIARPPDLEQEVPGGPFSRALIARLLGDSPVCEPFPATTGSAVPTTASLVNERGQADRVGPFDLLAIGASTGGPEALRIVLAALARRIEVPVVITQHLGENFTGSLAQSLTQHCGIPCQEAGDGEELRPGWVYLAPGGRHLRIERRLGRLRCQLDDGPPECFCRPSVDVMLRSLAELDPLRALVVILTGMGQDGLIGTGLLRPRGAHVLVQDEPSSVVWGMPGAVARAGLADRILPLPALGEAIVNSLDGSQ